MQKKFLIAGFSFAGLALILTLSSFFKPQAGAHDTAPNPDNPSYRSTNRNPTRCGNLLLSSAFENDYFTNTENQGYFYAEFQADEVNSYRRNTAPLNIAIVIDKSGSMAGEKIQNARNAAKYIIDQLHSNDYVSIITYSTGVELLQAPTRVINPDVIKNKIDRIYSNGGTNLMGGAQRGYDEVRRNYKSGYINRVLLLSDGQANEGITDPNQIDKIVRNQNNMYGVSISTFGLGVDYNEDLMTAMAESGNGNYYYIPNAAGIAAVFEQEMNGIKHVIAQQVKMEITIPNSVYVAKVYGQPYEIVGRKIKVYISDMISGDRKGVLVRYNKNNNNDRTHQFITTVSCLDPNTEKPISLYSSALQEYTNSRSRYLENFNEWVSAQVTLYESNERLELAMREADKGNYQKAKEITMENKKYMESKAPLVEKSAELQRAATNNASYDAEVESFKSIPAEELKAVQKEYKSTNYQIRAKK